MNNFFLSLLALTLLLTSCNQETEPMVNQENTGSEDVVKAIIDLTALDTSIRPQDDFYLFCNGNWIKNNPVPETESRWGSFNEVDQLNKKRLKKILEDASSLKHEPGSAHQLVGDYYTSFMDSTTRETQGYQPIKGYLELIDRHAGKDYTRLTALLHNDGIRPFFSFYVSADAKNSERNISYLNQGGLGLPNKDYYEQSQFEEIREEYKKHISRMLRLIDIKEEDANNAANNIFDFETKLASISKGPIELRDPEKRYNPYSIEKLKNETPNFLWDEYFKLIYAGEFDSLIVGQPDFIRRMDSLINSTDENTIDVYLKWNVVNSFASHLSSAFEQADFDFYSGTLRGVKKMKPRHERAIQELTRNAINEALGKLFVEKYFSEQAKAKLDTMVDHLFAAYEVRLENLDWMGAETKEKAFEKLKSFKRKLGFPDKWKDFSTLSIKSNDYVSNVIECTRFRRKENLGKIGKPVDRNEWGMPPHMVNAYYSPIFNEIAFPAGIMQPPFFDENADDAVNYGRMGMIIGHEITHGFDDKGAKFDARGNLSNWWSEEDQKNFEERANKLGDTFAQFCPFDSLCVQPGLTMGENIADLGGATMAYYAYTLTDEFKENQLKYGYTPAQRYFIALGQIWKMTSTDEALKNQLATDPHSPAKFRVNGPVMHMPEFFEAFNVTTKDSMRVSEDKIARIW